MATTTDLTIVTAGEQINLFDPTPFETGLQEWLTKGRAILATSSPGRHHVDDAHLQMFEAAA